MPGGRALTPFIIGASLRQNAIELNAYGQEVFGKKTVYIRSGGSIPIVGLFLTYLGLPSVLMGFGLPDDGLHSPNEKYKLENGHVSKLR